MKMERKHIWLRPGTWSSLVKLAGEESARTGMWVSTAELVRRRLETPVAKADDLWRFLWDILDDIDTTSDMVKGDDAAFRARVERLQKRRWETGVTCDGYTLTPPWEARDEQG